MISSSENASGFEMTFGGHYLNIGGVLLLLAGLVSFLKSASPSGSVPASALAFGLGLALLMAGENYFRKGLQQFSHPLLTGGFSLLFLSVCVAHFRDHLIGQGMLFALLVPIVILSNVSVFRYNSKLIGHAMLVLYFLTPLFVTFSFSHFGAIFVYLLAINLGCTVVAFYKKWDLQLIAASVGSYAFYFIHFSDARGGNSLALLLVIYGLSLVANSLVYFHRPESSDFNRVLSFANPSAFALCSYVVLLTVPNGVAVSVYLFLSLIHLAIARAADGKRRTGVSFIELSKNNLVLSILFCCASVSFVTYFSNSTNYFGLVTILWFVLGLVLLKASFLLPRFRILLSRFSYFSMALATAQVFLVLPTMQGSGWIRASSFVLYSSYVTLLLFESRNLNLENRWALKSVGLIQVILFSWEVLKECPRELAAAPLVGISLLCLTLSIRVYQLRFLSWISHLFAGVGLFATFIPYSMFESSWLVVPSCALALGVVAHVGKMRGLDVEPCWHFASLFILSSGLVSLGGETLWALLSLAICYLLMTWLAIFAAGSQSLLVSRELCSVLLSFLILIGSEVDWVMMASVLLVLAMAHALVAVFNMEVPPWSALPHLVIVAKFLAVVLIPHPMLALVLGSLLALGLIPRCRIHWGLVFQVLVTLGALALPWKACQEGPGIVAFCLVLTMFVGSYVISARERLAHVSVGLASIILVKFSLTISLGAFSTLVWGVWATLLLYKSFQPRVQKDWNQLGTGLFDYGRLLFVMTFLKSIVFDANFVNSAGWTHCLCSVGVAAVSLITAHAVVVRRKARNAFVLLGLLVFCFQVTSTLHQWWGTMVEFQPLLSGYWCLTAFLLIGLGIHLKVKVYRLFGLVTLVSSTLKILMIDIHVLDSYSQTNTYLILGSLLMMTSFLYQRQGGKSRLLPEPVGGECCA